MNDLKPKIVPCSSALVLAMTIIYFVLFAHGNFHNAAHDLRHYTSVPCH